MSSKSTASNLKCQNTIALKVLAACLQMAEQVYV